METVRLTPLSHKGKNKLMEATKAMPETWCFDWNVTERKDKIAAMDGNGPWLLLSPAGATRNVASLLSRWVHETADKDFAVMRSNGEVRGASRLAGEASTSTVVLGAERPGKD